MRVVIGTLDHPLSEGCPPSWATAWGDDDYGPWVEIEVDERLALTLALGAGTVDFFFSSCNWNSTL